MLVGGPTTIIELGGLRLLTDPTFDPPGEYPIGDRTLTKTLGPSVPAGQLGRIDAVLLSHDQHPDNLDTAGRRLLGEVPLTVTTPAAAERLGAPALGLPPWRHTTLQRPNGSQLRITSVPARHGPEGTEAALGPVTGFVLSADDLPSVYISGDNASLQVVQQVADNLSPIDVAVLFAGAGRTTLFDAYLNLTSTQAVQAAQLLNAPTAIVLHTEAWAHLTQGPGTVKDAFDRQGEQHRLLTLRHAQWTDLWTRDLQAGATL
ncbi:MBL fold metallo-hydrolase [Streptomyces sp. NPDC001508]|uniref:MBL fold metallo-hydrolase n=1 Tax=Streptomyces sp. NPDC001508 TaxID=3154656 RepID=UPI003326556A